MRCKRKYNLEVHHRSRTGGNGLGNAEVLCPTCHKNTRSYGTPGISPPSFSEETKKAAFKRAGHRCECTRLSCH